MKILSRACLIVCASCVIAITVRDEPRQQVLQEEDDDSAFDLEQFGMEDDEELEELEEEEESLEKPSNRALEPEAEMLPANYKGVKPPGVDHMEMTGDGKKKPKSRNRLAYKFLEVK